MFEVVSVAPAPVLAWGIECIRAIQSVQSPLLTFFFEFLTVFGTGEVNVLLLCMVFWCGNQKLGARLLVLMFVSGYLNALLKDVIMLPRPFYYDPELQLFPTGGFSLPSGHAQSAVVVWGGLLLWSKKSRLRWWCLALIGLIGLSRVYLGVHYPTDVLAGWLVGAFLLCVFHVSLSWMEPRLAELKLNRRLRLAVSLPVILVLLHPIPRCVTSAAALLGILVGLSLEVESTRPLVRGLRHQLAVLLLGTALMAAWWSFVHWLSERGPGASMQLALIFVGAASFGFWASYLVPTMYSRWNTDADENSGP